MHINENLQYIVQKCEKHVMVVDVFRLRPVVANVLILDLNPNCTVTSVFIR